MTSDTTLILGIGNVLWADEGFGVRCVETLNQRYRFPEDVKLLDGGTQGIYLVQHVQNASRLLVFDAVDYGLKPGTLKIVRDEEVPKFMGAKQMSLHQTGFQEVLAMAEFTGSYPSELLLIGVQPELLEDFGGSLTPVVRDRIDEALEIALNFLAERGVMAESRSETGLAAEELSPGQLALQAYEQGRPASDQACRTGDARFLNPAIDLNEES
ncbi:HyaD/HybD family hydrogenase maturation endopeptidase [Marinobacterium mangrovicola]|uniref:Hydrogenase 1 maturation peptidase HyaD n=1 Tax=Marinobacterium mangrovicola TaxID=1476959 RepID=A0A4R1GVD5_9GAMM|nr:HyaD/HybD family hydrogenase maturation endopeptidase [Marinobacterium mangrovicola]TCK08302.1 hydrogenase 1 maturation peptidase HyaD [Marinobacterium mangrovicola]